MATPVEVAAATHPHLHTSAIALYAALLGQDEADPYTTARLATALRVDRRTLYRATADLVAAGLVVVTVGHRRAHHYAAVVLTVHAGRA